MRSIPAHAGEPGADGALCANCGVYPRPRGGTAAMHAVLPSGQGLSPPTRGNRPPSSQSRPRFRSIPAHAGEPDSGGRSDGLGWVYPRPRGGTAISRPTSPCSIGLSPPTRGNHVLVRLALSASRSIPAHAGEPVESTKRRRQAGVYPRPRGGTDIHDDRLSAVRGLSPPTRGNPYPNRGFHLERGSIPAHAGEPPRRRTPADRRRVYPRPRGGTRIDRNCSHEREGLSPPTRGNLLVEGEKAAARGSIPAHAGEPSSLDAPRRPSTVYPRPRGGTRFGERQLESVSGLSPPTRGNLYAVRASRTSPRSIPAHAGEPRSLSPPRLRSRVYPRPRGGTRHYPIEVLRRPGLSPPTRGNLRLRRVRRVVRRSIPAHAGEPAYGADAADPAAVYPRPRGGTKYN